MRKYRFSGLTAAALAVALTLTPSASLWANADQEAGAPAGEGNADNLEAMPQMKERKAALLRTMVRMFPLRAVSTMNPCRQPLPLRMRREIRCRH